MKTLRELINNHNAEEVLAYLQDNIEQVALVPREPTVPMRYAFQDTFDAFDYDGVGSMPDSGWNAMIFNFEKSDSTLN
jgi:hypothetical protein